MPDQLPTPVIAPYNARGQGGKLAIAPLLDAPDPSIGGGTLPLLEYDILKDYTSERGTRYTFELSAIAVSVEIKLANLVIDGYAQIDNSFTQVFSAEPFDTGRVTIGFTRHCESSTRGCPRQCASIEGGFRTNDAMRKHTISLQQHPIRFACAFDIHIWVPSFVTLNRRLLLAAPDAPSEVPTDVPIDDGICVDYVVVSNAATGAGNSVSKCASAYRDTTPDDATNPDTASPPSASPPQTSGTGGGSSPSPPPKSSSSSRWFTNEVLMVLLGFGFFVVLLRCVQSSTLHKLMKQSNERSGDTTTRGVELTRAAP